MTKPTLFGAAYSVYVRIVRLTLEEKAVAYDLVPVDIFAEGGPTAEYLLRQPFGRIPAFEHDGFKLFETGAIARYVDEAFQGPKLQPAEPRKRARVNQVIGILDSYAYRTLVWDIYVERVDAVKESRVSDEALIAAALPKAEICLRVLTEIMGDGPWLTGGMLTLADLHAAPIFAYFRQAPEGREMMSRYPALEAWWALMEARPSMAATRSI
jgi:glutathione S-transferase